MAYQCQNFKDGQVLTAECLNKIERALEGVCNKEIQSINVTAQNEIIVTFVDGSSKNCGKVNGGVDGITPNIGTNGNWWIGDTDTGVKAEGKDGVDGKTPYILNGYWYIDGANTNVKAQGVDGKDGASGADGVSPTVEVTTITGGHRITITDKNGTKTVDVMDGVDGSNGKDGTNGKDGRGIKSVARTSGNGAAGTTDTYTITYTDNTTSTFTVYNGKNGTNGTNGSNGVSISSVVQTTTSSADGGSNIITVTLSNGTTSTFTVKNGDTGAPGVHVGTEPPTNGETVWIDTDEGASDEGDGGAQIDVVASVGQVLAVKAVDVYGKPTEYKAVDLPSVPTPNLAANEGEEGYVEGRTHYIDKSGIVHKLDNKYIDADWMATSEEGGGKVVFIPEQTVSGGMWSNLQADFVKGENYVVEVNGLEYICKCLEYDGELYLGNGTLIGGTEHNNEPFCITQMIGTTGGMFFNDGTLEAPIGLKVTDWVAVIYNKLPEEFLPDCVVKREDIENIEVNWDNVTDKPFVEGAGEPFFEHTATFASDAAAKNGVQVAGVSTSSYRDKIYWLEVNGELLKCHWESVTLGSKLCDEDGNCWVTNNIGGVYVSAPTAGTYTYKLYAPSDELMLEPQYLPPNLAKKSDIPNVSGMVKSVNGNAPDASGNVEIETGGGGGEVYSEENKLNPEYIDHAWYAEHPEVSGGEDVLASCNLTFSYGKSSLDSSAAFQVTTGALYDVYWGGKVYVCEAKVKAADAWDNTVKLYLGNYSHFNFRGRVPFTHEPFCFLGDPDTCLISEVFSYYNSTSADNVRVTTHKDVKYSTLPSGYLPKEQDGCHKVVYMELEGVAEMSFADFVAATNGYDVILVTDATEDTCETTYVVTRYWYSNGGDVHFRGYAAMNEYLCQIVIESSGHDLNPVSITKKSWTFLEVPPNLNTYNAVPVYNGVGEWQFKEADSLIDTRPASFMFTIDQLTDGAVLGVSMSDYQNALTRVLKNLALYIVAADSNGQAILPVLYAYAPAAGYPVTAKIVSPTSNNIITLNIVPSA